MKKTVTLTVLMAAAAMGEPATEVGPPTPTPPPSAAAANAPRDLPAVSDVTFTPGEPAPMLAPIAPQPVPMVEKLAEAEPISKPVPAPKPAPEADPLSMGRKPKPVIENRPLGSTSRPTEVYRADETRPTATAAGASDLGISRTILATAGVVALILLVAGMYRKLAARSTTLAAALGAGGKAPSGVLSVLGRYPVARGTTLVLFRLDRRVLLVSQTKLTGLSRFGSTTTMQTLCEITDPAEVASILSKTGDTSGPGASIAARFEAELEEASKMTSETPMIKGDPMPTRATTAPVSAALAAIRRASAAQSRTESRPEPRAQAAAPAPRATAARAEAAPLQDPAAELRRRLAAMRAPAAIDLGRREFVA